MTDILDPIDADLESFWTHARNAAKLSPLDSIIPTDSDLLLLPGAFAFGDSREMADKLADLVVHGNKRATTGYRPSYDYEDVPLPVKGELFIVCDGGGRPRALIVNDDVIVKPFNEVGEEISGPEGEGSLEKWIEDHREFFTRECEANGMEFDETADVVVEMFSVVYAPKD